MNIISTENIQNKIYFIRDKKVMLNVDLAELYQKNRKKSPHQLPRRGRVPFPSGRVRDGLNFKHIIIICFLVTTKTYNIFAQQQNLPLNREFNLVNQKVFNQNNIHTSFQPILINNIEQKDTLLSKIEREDYLININKTHINNRSWFTRKLFYENLVIVDTNNFYLTIDPLINLEMGRDNFSKIDQTLYNNTRGILVKGNIGKKFSFQTSVYENQAVFPEYLSDYANSTGVVLGQGRWKVFKKTGFDFAYSSANISFSPNKHFNFQLGTGKNFIGEGYRSLLLSDAAFNYPYFKTTFLFGEKNQFQFTQLNAQLSSLERRGTGSTTEDLFKRKAMTTHFLDWTIAKWLNIGLFESTIWQTEDSNGTKPFQYLQINPIIGVNTLSTGFNNDNHSVVGSNLKIKLPFKTVLYNQLVYDGKNRYGIQAGFKYFGIKGLTLQGEYNMLSDSTFSSTNTLQNYGHYNAYLTHPLGNNFKEIVGIINYKYKRFFTQIKFNYIKATYAVKSDIILNSSNISLKKVNNKITDIHIGYLINPKNNMSILIGNLYRTLSNTNYFYVGFRTNLRNLYYDF